MVNVDSLITLMLAIWGKNFCSQNPIDQMEHCSHIILNMLPICGTLLRLHISFQNKCSLTFALFICGLSSSSSSCQNSLLGGGDVWLSLASILLNFSLEIEESVTFNCCMCNRSMFVVLAVFIEQHSLELHWAYTHRSLTPSN